MKDRVERFDRQTVSPVERRQILRNEVATVTGQILKITGTEIVDHRYTRVRESVLQSQCEIRADETGAAGDNEIKARGSRWHKKRC